jgi:hypothetical protein
VASGGGLFDYDINFGVIRVGGVVIDICKNLIIKLRE